MQHKKVLDPVIRQRLRWIEHQELTRNVSATCRYFGISRGTFYLWYHRFSVSVFSVFKPSPLVRIRFEGGCPRVSERQSSTFVSSDSMVPSECRGTSGRNTIGSSPITRSEGCTNNTDSLGFDTRNAGSGTLNATRSLYREIGFNWTSNSLIERPFPASDTTSSPPSMIARGIGCCESMIRTP